jgi:hypothetical protein
MTVILTATQDQLLLLLLKTTGQHVQCTLYFIAMPNSSSDLGIDMLQPV